MAKDRARKGYADTPHGQTHYRIAGDEGARGMVLIHWTPLSGRMYAACLPHFAALGFRAMAIDLLGYGRSDPRPQVWSIADWADEALAAADAVGLTPTVVVGGHTGAAVATEAAMRRPDAVSRLVLDGCPLLTPALRATFAAMKDAPRPAPAPDGAHERLAFQTARGVLEHLTPGFTLTAATMDRIWPVLIDYLETDFVSSAAISGEYDLAARLPLLATPTLLLGATTDTLAGSFAPARTLIPGVRAHMFEGDHPLHDQSRGEEYARVIAAFAA